MISLTEKINETIKLDLDENKNIKVTFHGSRVIIDLPDQKLTSSKCDTIIGELEKLIGVETVPVSMSFSEKIKYIIENRKNMPVLPSRVSVLTRVNEEVISLTCIDLTGDIRFHSTGNFTGNEYFTKIHHKTIQLLMKKWRDNVMQAREIITSIVKTINMIQVYTSVIGSLSFLSGLITDTPSYLLLSAIPFLATGILGLIKRTI